MADIFTTETYPGEDADNYAFQARPLLEMDDEERYNAEAHTADVHRDIYASKRSSRPAYTRPDPPGTRRERNVKPGYDQVTFPVMRANQIAKIGADELRSPTGTLWLLQKAIFDAKFDLLKQCIASGVHMVSDINAEIVIRLEAAVLTDKANTVLKVPEGVLEVPILVPNGAGDGGGLGFYVKEKGNG